MAVIVAGLGGFLPGRLPARTSPQVAGPVVRLSYRALQPGEPVLVFLESDGTVREATVTFLGRTADLKPAPRLETFLAFIGSMSRPNPVRPS
jgi:hypothetical protein